MSLTKDQHWTLAELKRLAERIAGDFALAEEKDISRRMIELIENFSSSKKCKEKRFETALMDKKIKGAGEKNGECWHYEFKDESTAQAFADHINGQYGGQTHDGFWSVSKKVKRLTNFQWDVIYYLDDVSETISKKVLHAWKEGKAYPGNIKGNPTFKGLVNKMFRGNREATRRGY